MSVSGLAIRICPGKNRHKFKTSDTHDGKDYCLLRIFEVDDKGLGSELAL